MVQDQRDDGLHDSFPWAYGDSSVKGGRGVDLAEILHMIFFLLALPRFSPLFLPEFGRAVAPLPPCLVRLCSFQTQYQEKSFGAVQ